MSTNQKKKAAEAAREAFHVDYKDLNMLREHLTETGKIVPSRITGTSARLQRKITQAIKYARYLALIPYCDSHHH